MEKPGGSQDEGRIPEEGNIKVAKTWFLISWMTQKQGEGLGLGGCVSTWDKPWDDSLILFSPAGVKHRFRLYSRVFPRYPQKNPGNQDGIQ